MSDTKRVGLSERVTRYESRPSVFLALAYPGLPRRGPRTGRRARRRPRRRRAAIALPHVSLDGKLLVSSGLTVLDGRGDEHDPRQGMQLTLFTVLDE